MTVEELRALIQSGTQFRWKLPDEVEEKHREEYDSFLELVMGFSAFAADQLKDEKYDRAISASFLSGLAMAAGMSVFGVDFTPFIEQVQGGSPMVH